MAFHKLNNFSARYIWKENGPLDIINMYLREDRTTEI